MNLQRTQIMLLGAAIVFSPAFLFAQMYPSDTAAPSTQANPSQPERPESPSMQDSGPNQGDVGQIMRDKMFLRAATSDGIAEVKFGQLAIQKGSDDVKALAQKIVGEHLKLNSELAPIADSMGVMLPKDMDKDDQAEYDKLSALSGTDFDTAYLTLMVRHHHHALHAFRIEGNSVTDPTLKQAVIDGEIVLHGHLVQVDKLAGEKGIPLPSHNHDQKPPAS
jgi:putative membrane protein